MHKRSWACLCLYIHKTDCLTATFFKFRDAFVRKLFRLIHGIMANVARDGGNNSLSMCVS